MSAYRHKSNSMKKYLLISISVLVIAGFGYYWYLGQIDSQSLDSSNPIDYEAPSQEVIDAGKDAKTKTIEQDQETKTTQTAKDTTSDSSTANTSNSFTVSMTTAPDKGSLRVSTIISGLHPNGACKLTLTKGSKVITKSSGVQSLTQYTSCTGFDVSLDSGTWSVVLKVTIDGKSVSKSATAEVS